MIHRITKRSAPALAAGAALCLGLLGACDDATSPQSASTDEYLASWRDTLPKRSIVAFVESVTDPDGRDYVPPAERIAVFDNDGTLWSEQPIYFQLFFAFDRVEQLAPEHPEWRETQPFRAVLEDDREAIAAAGLHGLLELVMASHAGNTTAEFEGIVRDWLATAKHPRFQRPFTDLVYQPMLELMNYLRANDFRVYIVSGGGIEFMRPWVEEVYGVPPEQVVGSSIVTEFEIRDGEPVLVRRPELDFVDDGVGKPVGIHKSIGRRPIAAFGNSDGDLEMLQWTAAGDGPSLCLYVHHTDSEREWAYDRESSFGRLDRGLTEAAEKGWTVVDMKNDWSIVYPFERP
jgi:haloacid dehalogenase-like hydrolase